MEACRHIYLQTSCGVGSPWNETTKSMGGSGGKPGEGAVLDFSAYRFTAHRGLHGPGIPENSLPAFLGAMTQGFAIELDVHLTRDGKLAVFHDHELKRMTGVGGRIEEWDWEKLQTLRLEGTACRIPSLPQVLDMTKGKVPLLIEAKDETVSGRLAAALAQTLKEYQGAFLVESFNPYVLWQLKKNAPDIVRGQLAAARLPEMSRLRCWALRHMIFNGLTRPQFIAYNVSDMTEAFLKRCGCGRGVFAWTIRSPEEYKKARRCDGLIFEGFDIRASEADACRDRIF